MTVPSVLNLSRLAWILDIRFEWLTTGRGGMLYDAGVREAETAYDQAKDFLSSDQKEVMEIFSCLPACQKSALLAFLRTL